MDKQEFKNGSAFKCIKTCYNKTGGPKEIGKPFFTAGNIYYIVSNCYLKNDFGVLKNYEWYKTNFERSEANDITPKPRIKKKKTV